MVKGNKEQAVSELEAGRRTIVRDEDDPEMEANILDSLMVSKTDDIEEELRAAYLPVMAQNKITINNGFYCIESIIYSLIVYHF